MRSLIFVACAVAVISSCTAFEPARIEVKSARILSDREFEAALPSGFLKTEGLQSKLSGIAIRIDGRSINEFSGDSRNPIVKYVDCSSGRELQRSFGPFVDGKFVQEYLRGIKIYDAEEYSVVSTITTNLTRSRSLCVVLEARLPVGVVASSARVTIKGLPRPLR
jgi:hypothetical protein